MSVSDGMKANAENLNAAFVSKTSDSTMTGILSLSNTTDATSGAQITNVQRTLNQVDLKVSGPQTATPNAVPVFESGNGRQVKASGVSIDSSNNVSGINELNAALVKVPSGGYARFYNPANTQYVGLKSPSALSSSVTFSLPSADGTSGQVLKTDGAGNLGWATSAASSFIGLRYTCVATTTSTTTYSILKYPTITYDPSAIYNPSTGLATINFSGTYLVSASVNLTQGSQPILSLAIYKNGALYSEWVSQYSASTVPITCLITDTVPLSVGDTVAIYHKNSVGNVNISTSPGRNVLNIVKLG